MTQEGRIGGLSLRPSSRRQTRVIDVPDAQLQTKLDVHLGNKPDLSPTA